MTIERRDLMLRDRANQLCDKELRTALSMVLALIHHPERHHVLFAASEDEADRLMTRVRELLKSYGLPTDLLHSVESRIPPAVPIRGIDWSSGKDYTARREPDGTFYILDEV